MQSAEIDLFRKIGWLLKRIHIHPLYFVAPILCSIIAAALEGLGIGLLMPLLNGFLSMDYSSLQHMPGFSWVLHLLFGDAVLRDRTLFIFLMAVFAGSIVFKNIFRVSAAVGIAYLSTRSLHHLRKELFNRYLTFGKLFFDKTNLGHHSTIFSQYATQTMLPLIIVDKFFSALLSLIVYFVILLFISWKLTIVAVPLFLILHFSVRHFIKQIQNLSKYIAASLGDLSKKVVEILSLIPLVQSSNMEEEERLEYAEISNSSAALEFKRNVAQQTIRPMQEMITLIAILFLFSVMLYLMSKDSGFSPSAFIVYFYVILNASNKFGVFTSFRGDVLNSSGAIESVISVFDDEDKTFVPQGTKEMDHLKEAIEFRDLTFSYADRTPVLSGMSFTITKGSLTAIVGPTGAGKTTLISLLLRYYDCPPKSLFIDGTDIRSYRTASIRSHLALVSQETLLLNDTLRHNIAYGEQPSTDEQIWEVLRRARLEEFVHGLPHGLDTYLGDRGVKLSGGEKQRVSIARALLKGADILILDEATSSLDSKTEKLIQEAIDDAIEEKTAIVIAHRLSTIKNADKIIVVEGGRCAEEGTLETLLEKKGKFFEYWQEQKFT